VRAIGVLMVVAVLVLPAAARGDDSQADSLTLLPWTTASLVVSSKDSRALLQFGRQLYSGLRWATSISAPINDDGVASFSTDSKLVSGFKVTGQFGWDSDSATLAAQAKWIEDLQEAVKGLQLPTVGLANFAKRNSLSPQSDDEVWKWLMTKLNVKAEDKALTIEEAKKRALSLQLMPKTLCAMKDQEINDSCFLRSWFDMPGQRTGFYQKVMTLLNNMPKDLQMPDVLERERPVKSDAKEQYVIDHLSEISDYIGKARREDAETRRNVFLATRPGRASWGHSVLLDFSASLDRQDVYQGSLDADDSETTLSNITLGIDYTLLTTIPGLSFNGRAGWNREQDGGADKVERCESVPVGDPPVDPLEPQLSGRKCKDVLFRTGARPDAKNTTYARIAFDYQPGGKLADSEVLPGVEVRVGLEEIDGDYKLGRTIGGRLSVFATPLKDKTAGRFGIAIDASYARDQDTSPLTITGLAFVGATFTDLMGSK
jgi:hypothetical protein